MNESEVFLVKKIEWREELNRRMARITRAIAALGLKKISGLVKVKNTIPIKSLLREYQREG